MSQEKNVLQNKKGQSLIEYLILVAVVGIGSMAVIRVVGANINVRFANIANTLGGQAASSNAKTQKVSESMTKKKDFGDFFEGATSPNSKQEKDPGI